VKRKKNTKRRLYWEHEPEELAISALDVFDDTRYVIRETSKEKKAK